jgi:peptidoglycan/LPS O-acetylase OafA/YrhL
MQPLTNLKAWWLGVLQLINFSTPSLTPYHKKIKKSWSLSIELLFLIILGHYVV